MNNEAKPRQVRTLEEDAPRVVSPDDPLIINAVTASYPYVQIEPGGEVRATVNTRVDFGKLEKLTGGA